MNRTKDIYIFAFGKTPTQCLVPVWKNLIGNSSLNVNMVATCPDSESLLLHENIPFSTWNDFSPAREEIPMEEALPREYKESVQNLFKGFLALHERKDLYLLEDSFQACWRQAATVLRSTDTFFNQHSVSLTVHLDDIRMLDSSIICQAAKRNIPSVVLQHGYHIPEKFLPHVRMGSIPYRFLSGDNDAGACTKYGYDKNKILVTGQPRFDVLAMFKEERKSALLRKYDLNKNKFRILVLSVCINGMLDGLYDGLKKQVAEMGGRYQLIIKQHPRDRNGDRRDFFRSAGIDVKWFKDEDVQELIFCSDVVVNFGSTSTIEAVLLNRPVVYILNGSMAAEFDKDPVVETIPGMDCLSDGIRKALLRVEKKEYPEHRENFIHNYNYRNDGNAALRIVEKLEALLTNDR